MWNNKFPNTKLSNAGPQTSSNWERNSNKLRTQLLPELATHCLSTLSSIWTARTQANTSGQFRSKVSGPTYGQAPKPTHQQPDTWITTRHDNQADSAAAELATWQPNWQTGSHVGNPHPSPVAKSAAQKQPKTTCGRTSRHSSSDKLRLNKASYMWDSFVCQSNHLSHVD